MKLIKLEPSNLKTKKYKAILEDNGKQYTVQFGAKGYEDFTTHKDESRKQRYITRHQANEDWTDPLTPGFWSKHLLWNKPTIKASLADLRKKFNL